MYNPNIPFLRRDARYLAKLTSGLALSSIFLAGCGEPAPSHNVTIKQGQTLDDIGTAECGPSFFNISETPRRNKLRNFNDLPSDAITPGQVLKIPDSFCYDTGDKRTDEEAKS
ncbi:LysM peptidoglycan-binding domain-containing protein [Microbacteriaceae bacterium]|nr:LysM peptidoglycan-binding domain-containing protein [Candidatus Saccharibacteria bacterium]